jgi:GYF domain 2
LIARDVWRWTDERGVQRLVGTDELRSALASGVLPPATLVWREGMKEWSPASTIPELASAAFAAASASPAGKLAGELPAFDPRGTLGDRERRSTLVGLASPEAPSAVGSKVLVDVPSASGRADRIPVTQVPPFGGPAPDEETTALVPLAPRMPVPERGSAPKPPPVPGLNRPVDRPRPQRKITSRDIDGDWATTTHSDEDETIPRRARPSELAAAAAAAADATVALREARARTRAESLTRTAAAPAADAVSKPGGPPKLPPRKPPPPLPPLSGRLEGRGEVAVKNASAAPPKPPLPAAASAKSPLPRPVVSPVAVPSKPTLPAVRIKPPSPPAQAPLEDLPVGASSVPFTMGSHGLPALNATLPGVAPTPALRDPKQASPAAATSPAPEVEPATSPEATKPIRTLVSARDSIDSIPGLAEVVASVAEAPDAPPAERPYVAPDVDPDAVTSPGAFPPNGVGHHALPSRAPFNGAAHPVVVAAPPALAVDPEPTGPLPPPRAPLPSRRPPPAVEAPFPIAHAPPLSPPPTFGEADAAPAAPAVVDREPPGSDLAASSQLEDEVFPTQSGGLDEHVSVPLSSLVGGGGLLIGMIITAFFVGRASSVSTPRLTAHPSLGAVPTIARAAIPAPPRPCWMVKQPAMWAPHASRNIPFEVVATTSGAIAVGYAHDAKKAMGIEVDLASGEVHDRFQQEAKDEIERVMPMPGTQFRVARAGEGSLKSRIDVPAAAPFALGLAEGAIALAAPPDATPVSLWPLTGEDSLGAAGVRAAGDRGFALLFRRAGGIWGGFLGADRKAKGDLVKVTGSGGAVGKPAGGWNGRELAVIFADRSDASGRYEIRVGHAPPGAIPATTKLIPLPRGGPGGDAFAPDIAGLPDGRWLLMWTEGATGSRAVRAQTLAADFQPIGDPIALSPPAGNFGQGVIGVVGDHAATVFLSKGSSSYELWGAVLQCGG